MRDPPLILIADDHAANLDILRARLDAQGYRTVCAVDGEAALAAAREHLPDLILLDVMMPKMDGFAVCRVLKGDASLPFMPIILVTARTDRADIIAGLDSGADEYLTKPVDHAALVARVRSILRIKALHDRVSEQSRELADWNATLERRVAAQVAEIEQIGRLRRFLPSQLAELIVSRGHNQQLASHRSEVAVVFCDLRGFTAFTETAEPEELMAVIRAYHATLGEIVFRFEGTLERFIGDGLVVVFNDPVPCPDPAARAVRMALAMRDAMTGLTTQWKALGHDLGFGVGIAFGYATLGISGSRAGSTTLSSVPLPILPRGCAVPRSPARS